MPAFVPSYKNLREGGGNAVDCVAAAQRGPPSWPPQLLDCKIQEGKGKKGGVLITSAVLLPFREAGKKNSFFAEGPLALDGMRDREKKRKEKGGGGWSKLGGGGRHEAGG